MIVIDIVNNAWTDEEVIKLTELWKQGKTATEISIELNSVWKRNRSRNSVIGKVHRLKLDGRPDPIKRKNNTETLDVNELPISKFTEGPKAIRYCHHTECFAVKERGNYCGYHAELYYGAKK